MSHIEITVSLQPGASPKRFDVTLVESRTERTLLEVGVSGAKARERARRLAGIMGVQMIDATAPDPGAASKEFRSQLGVWG